MGGVEGGVGRERDRARAGVALDKIGTLEQVRAKGFVALEDGHQSHRAAAFVALTDSEKGLERVYAVEATAGPFTHQFSPRLVVDSARQQAKVGRVVVGDLEPPTNAGSVDEVFDAVLESLAPGLEHGEVIGGSIGVDEEEFRRGRRSNQDDDHGFVATSSDRHVELGIVLLVDQHVGARGRAELVAPELPGPHRCVDAGVEEVTAVARPGESVVHVIEFVADGCLSRQGTHGEMMAFAAFEVSADGDPLVVGTHHQHSHREKVVTLCFDVLVEDDLLSVERRVPVDHWWREVARRARDTTTDGVIETFARTLEVPPRPSKDRHRDVRLLNAVLDLLEQFVLEGLERRQHISEVGVLRAKMGEDLLVFAIHQPVVGIDSGVAVSLDRWGRWGTRGGVGMAPLCQMMGGRGEERGTRERAPAEFSCLGAPNATAPGRRRIVGRTQCALPSGEPGD